MLSELEDEVTSINAIYESSTLEQVSEEPVVLALILPQQPSISLRVEFPQDYPDAPPSILGTQTVGDNVAKGAGNQLVDLLHDVLATVYTPGSPCIFDLIEEAGAQLQQLGLDTSAASQQSQGAQTDGQHYESTGDELNPSNHQQPLEMLQTEPAWTLSEVVSEKKSVFVARAVQVATVEEANKNLAHLLATDRKVAKATHNITAWRIQGENGVHFQDCDDDGESAAGGRVLHLLELMGVWNVMIVVTRWYGGIQLGPDRFRIINQTTRDAIIKAGLAQEGSKGAQPKKSRKT